jgi:hypothetical protein
VVRLVVGVLATAALGGCRALFGIDDTSVATDAPPPAIDARRCFGDGAWQVCLAAAPGPSVEYLMDTALDTATGCTSVDTTHATEWCVVAAASITVGARLAARGPRPLVLVAADDLVIAAGGVVDVASHRGGPLGAGADSALCVPGSAGDPDSNGGGGGAGGSFGTRGGNGGDGDQGSGLGGSPGEGNFDRDVLRGGCAGTWGGAAGADPDPAGDGGGAVYLLAGRQLVVAGTIDASGGGGGGGGAPKSGGSGGGSGGMVALWSPSIAWTGVMFANGGGGGGGADNGANGQAGADPSSPAAAQGGGGGGGLGAGDGGSGGAGTAPGESGGNDTTGAGGGGGGGGVGVIRVLSGQDLSANVSPPPI